MRSAPPFGGKAEGKRDGIENVMGGGFHERSQPPVAQRLGVCFFLVVPSIGYVVFYDGW